MAKGKMRLDGGGEVGGEVGLKSAGLAARVLGLDDPHDEVCLCCYLRPQDRARAGDKTGPGQGRVCGVRCAVYCVLGQDVPHVTRGGAVRAAHRASAE